MNTARSGFTLIEIMIVVIIIASLAFMVTPYLMDVPDRAKSQISAGEMKAIDTALKLYRLDNGSYPRSLDALMSPPRGKTTPYLEKDPKDPWGNPYRYRYPGTHNAIVGYDLYSSGPNGIPDDGDDIINWKKE